MKILVLGSGGREHALAWKLAQSSKLQELFVAPGNAGTAKLGKNIPIGVNDFEAIKAFVIANSVDLVIVGPEDPLVNGVHDFFLEDKKLKGIPVIGPQKSAASLEGSKEFAKEFMMRHHIPTAQYKSFTAATINDAYTFMENLNAPYVLKADGLAAGKGVVILDNLEEAKAELRSMLLEEKFGAASTTVVIEEFLDGIELSVFVLTDGKNYKLLPTAKDYKRIGEGDTGLNTGGMGAISPVPFADKALMTQIEESIVKPTVEGLKKDNLPYKGFIFIGLIKVGEKAKVIEYNVRLGDPETEVVIPRIKNDLVTVFEAVANQKLNELDLQIDERTATTVMTVSGGYPGSYDKEKEIMGINAIEDSLVFHAGTKLLNDKIVTNGGRVIAITSYGSDFKEALKTSYKNVAKLSFDGMNFRKDIGFDL
ncbi:phosphoribosylamine--glycine ligase [Maribacter sp. R77961]|uniref:phosphoribosylamine--glycine ligase n=1 Tax=Maribacter sp. R77961 TaxID=3093871 RepID=UPI0037C9DA64